MRKTVVVLLTLLIACTAIGVPIWLAIAQSQRQGLDAAEEQALGYARDVVFRSDDTGRQIQAGIARLKAHHAHAPCTPQSIDLMRQIDLGSSYIQAVGYVVGDELVCSSISSGARLALGPVDFDSDHGFKVRRNVHFPFTPEQTFVVVESEDFAAIIHKDLPIDTANSEPDVSLATFALADPRPASARGPVDPNWVRRLGDRREVVFSDGGYIVAVVRSAQFHTAWRWRWRSPTWPASSWPCRRRSGRRCGAANCSWNTSPSSTCATGAGSGSKPWSAGAARPENSCIRTCSSRSPSSTA